MSVTFLSTVPVVQRRLSWLMAIALLWITEAGSTTPPPTVRIGVIGPLTGPSADFGVPMLHGVQLAVDEINAAGGYLGRPLELVVKDDQAIPHEGRKVSQALLHENIIAAIGFCNTGVAMNAIDLFQQAQLPLIVPCSSGTAVTAKFPPKDSFIFRVQARDALQAPFMVDEILRRGWNKIALFADTTGYGEGGFQDVLSALAAHNLQPVYTSRFELGVQDLTAPLSAARNAGANVIFSYTVGPENAVIANGKKALGWRVPQVGAWPLSFSNFIEGAKDAAEGALVVQTFIAEPSNERRAAFLSSYTRKYQRKLSVPMAAANAYDATYLLMYALLGIRDGQLNGPAIKVSLESKMKTYYGVVATYDRPFSAEDKDAITANMLVTGMIQKGAITFAHPEDAKRNLFVQRKR